MLMRLLSHYIGIVCCLIELENWSQSPAPCNELWFCTQGPLSWWHLADLGDLADAYCSPCTFPFSLCYGGL